MRTRKQLVREQTRHVQRIQKTLEEANIKLDAVISDIMGVSGRRMIEAMIAGVRNPHRLAALAERSIKASPKELVRCPAWPADASITAFCCSCISDNGMRWMRRSGSSIERGRRADRAHGRGGGGRKPPFRDLIPRLLRDPWRQLCCRRPRSSPRSAAT